MLTEICYILLSIIIELHNLYELLKLSAFLARFLDKLSAKNFFVFISRDSKSAML